MRFAVLSLVVVYGCVQLLQPSHGQQSRQCRELDVDNSGSPMSGPGLSVCSSDAPQCCLQRYIDSVTDVARDRLSLGLRLQVGKTSLMFNATIASIRSYFQTSFRNSWIGSLPNLNNQVPFNQLESIAGPIIDSFTSDITTVNVNEVITNLTSRFASSAANAFSNGNSTSINCILDIILNNVNQTDVAVLVRGLTAVQNAIKSFERFAGFLYRYRMNTNFTFPRGCIRRFVELNFCTRCTRRSPPLCSNTCGALFRGCLSPYYTALNEQFDLIWDVSRQVLRITNNTLQTLFTNERNLIDERALLQAAGCPGFNNGRVPGKRQASQRRNMNATFIPQQRMMELRSLSGRGFSYENAQGGQGPQICRPTDNEMQFCTNNTERGQRNYCAAKVDCTSMCRCYDGMRDRMDNSEEFTMNGVDGQMNNPAINLTNSDLQAITNEIGTPVQSFLMQADVASVLPEGVTIPGSAEMTTPSMPGGASNVAFQMSLLILPLGVIAAAFF